MPVSRFAAEKSYVRRVERRFVALREGVLHISPGDFALLLDWFHRGIPAELVLSVIEEMFVKARATGGRQIRSLAYCRHSVEEAWSDRRAAMVGAQPSSGREIQSAFSPGEVALHIEKAVRAIEAARDNLARDLAEAQDRGRAVDGLREIEARLDTMRRAILAEPPSSFEACEQEMVGLEDRLVELGRALLVDDEVRELTAHTEARIAPFAARMSEKARSATVKRAVAAAIRERTGLPRLSLFVMSH